MERGLVPTRTKAQALILSGRIKVNGVVQQKVGTQVPGGIDLEIVEGARYVSRGGEKLEGALQDLSLFPKGCVCLDVGSSTGGFTDCLLKKGADRVYAVDVGKGQLDISLRRHPNVVVFEETHILNLPPDSLQPRPDFVVIDVSFISLKKVLPHVKIVTSSPGTVLAMVKPQFEVGPKHLKKGVVRSPEMQQQAVSEIRSFAENEGFQFSGEAPSRLKGPKGNQEYFLHLKI